MALYSSTESGAGRITISTSFVRCFFRPDFLLLLFKLLFDKVNTIYAIYASHSGTCVTPLLSYSYILVSGHGF